MNEIRNILKKAVKEFGERSIDDRKYWFVRTEGGEYFDYFKNGGYIAIGWNEITLDSLKNIGAPKNIDDIKALGEKVNVPEDKDEKQYGTRAVRQMIKFVYDIKKGDVIIIPSEKSEILGFGIVASSIVDLEYNHENDCPFVKRKSVDWIQFRARNKLDPNFFRFLHVQQTISNLDEYRFYIDKTIDQLYLHKDKGYFIIKIKNDSNVHTSHYTAFLSAMTLANEWVHSQFLPD